LRYWAGEIGTALVNAGLRYDGPTYNDDGVEFANVGGVDVRVVFWPDYRRGSANDPAARRALFDWDGSTYQVRVEGPYPYRATIYSARVYRLLERLPGIVARVRKMVGRLNRLRPGGGRTALAAAAARREICRSYYDPGTLEELQGGTVRIRRADGGRIVVSGRTSHDVSIEGLTDNALRWLLDQLRSGDRSDASGGRGDET